jgi:hypothetical protein
VSTLRSPSAELVPSAFSLTIRGAHTSRVTSFSIMSIRLSVLQLTKAKSEPDARSWQWCGTLTNELSLKRLAISTRSLWAAYGKGRRIDGGSGERKKEEVCTTYPPSHKMYREGTGLTWRWTCERR